jgi:hypothetical protein
MADLERVRFGRHDGFDRLVFDFEGGPPGYRIDYVSPPVRQQGSSRPVPVEGSSFLRLVLAHARTAILDAGGVHPTYHGPDRFRPAGSIVTEVVLTGDYEGNVGFAVGLGEKVPFRIFTLEDPSRVVLDVQRQR